jgi:hypothetical protein
LTEITPGVPARLAMLLQFMRLFRQFPYAEDAKELIDEGPCFLFASFAYLLWDALWKVTVMAITERAMMIYAHFFRDLSFLTLSTVPASEGSSCAAFS